MPVNALINYFRRVFKGEKRSAMMFSITMVIICIIGAGFGQVLLKMGISQLDSINSFNDFFQAQTLFKILTNLYIITAFICYAIIVMLWLGAMSNLNVSFLFPLSSLAYLVTALAAWLLLKETVSAMHWLGICLIIGGCVFIALSKA
jgi:drug/metabolite transporter (DMT)-like permease